MPAPVSPWRTDSYRLLNTPVIEVVGAKTAKALGGFGIETVWDLVRHVPRRYLLGSESSRVLDLPVGESVAIVLRVHRLDRVEGRGSMSRLEATLVDDEGATLRATWFAQKSYLLDYWERELAKGTRGLFIGKVGEFRHQPQLSHPTFIMVDDLGGVVGRDNPDRQLIVESVSRSGLLGIYPQSSKLSTWQISEAEQLALDYLQTLAEPLPRWVLDRANLPDLATACLDVHLPDDMAAAERGMRRLRFDEALALQVTMAVRRRDAEHTTALACCRRDGGILDALDAHLPFELTDGQRLAGEQIAADLAQPHPMQRLLQGDVGSGKTIVALRAMLLAVDAGHQAALMVPTEVLARQHFATITGLLGQWGGGRVLGAPPGATEVVMLTSSMSTAEKRESLLKIASGEAGIVVGTHALLADRVTFADLAMVVVDEQHRFGVRQRAMLTEASAGPRPHELVMTATPIPRSVAMTIFGDLAVSSLPAVPSGRRPVQTTVVDARTRPEWLDRVWQRIREEVGRGRQAFVVCPRITASDVEAGVMGADASVTQTASRLATHELSGLRIEPLHGRMSSDEKDAVMARFVAGEVDVLVSTTVIEVGIDVPNATMMVVLDADRFGMSQLHQLRGRVGRGEHPGLCLLVTASATPESHERLRAVESTSDGFALAELDLAQRREGNVLGDTQSGRGSTLRLLRVIDNADEIELARELAERLVADDPGLDNPYLVDMMTMAAQISASDWLERG